MKNKFEQNLGKIFPEKEKQEGILSAEEISAIKARAELRKESQKLKVNSINLELPQSEAIRETYDKTRELVFHEAAGELDETAKTPEELIKEAEKLGAKAGRKRDLVSNLSAYLYAEGAKFQEMAGENFDDFLNEAKECLQRSENLPKTTPASLLPEAVLLGIHARQIKKMELPEKEKIAEAISSDAELLESYSLVLPEEERAEFLVMIPEEKREKVSQALDVSVSRYLHQSIVEQKSVEEAQRKDVRLRLYNGLRSTVEKEEDSDKQMVKLLSEAVCSLGEDTRQMLLEIIRDEYESKNTVGKKKKDYLPRVLKVFLENFDDWRGNDIALQLAGEKNLNKHLSVYILGKLIKNRYLPENIKTWQSEEKAKRGHGVEAEKQSLDIIRSVITDLGVVPSREILVFVSNDSEWDNAPLDKRIREIKSSQEKFAGIKNNRELVGRLAENEREAMIYYLLHGGDDRFNLINNYSFDKFKEMTKIIADLKVHKKPLRQFNESLRNGGLPDDEAKQVMEKLSQGKFPLDEKQSSREVSFDVSETALLKNANEQISQVLGRKQLGTVILFSLYREYLEKENNSELLNEMKTAQTFSDRLAFIEKIEEKFPDFRNKALDELKDNWRILGEKMVLEAPLNQVFSEDNIPVRGEEMLPRLDAKRLNLKRSKKDLLVILKGGNERQSAVQKEIYKKIKARENLMLGLEKQQDESAKIRLEEKIKNIEEELRGLENEKAIISNTKTMERFAHLDEKEKKEEIEKLGNEILALTEKSPSAIFTYITMQVLGEERLRESDVALVQEMESHLQGPFQAIVDSKTYQKPLGREEKKRQAVNLQYLDKTERFMNMVRFADSKICCFSSSNYEQTIQHSTPNKYWVASINADPLSFVISIEEPEIKSGDDEAKKAKENQGFIFGSFGMDQNSKPAILLNGIYYAPGMENKDQTKAILEGVEKIFGGLGVKKIAVAEQYGGSLGKEKVPEGYSNESIKLTRLRALDNGMGSPEDKIYDDLNTGSNLNRPYYYGGHVWHKEK
jgi:hypothetical protein